MKLNEQMSELKSRYRQILFKTLTELQNSDSVEGVFEKLCEKRAEIFEKRKKCKCNGCASCCRLAISEFSPKELSNKAKFGDNFAKQFIETFIPYENIEEAKSNYPDYFEFLDENSNGNYYYYHCPKVTEDNLCPDYENRPQICRDFPDNPIGFLPLKCAFNTWKEEVQTLALEIKATSEILEFYKTQS